MEVATHTPSYIGNPVSLYARISRNYGTGAVYLIFAATAHERSRMVPVAPSTASIAQRLVSAGDGGIRIESLDAEAQRALVNIERLGLRLDRTRRPGFVVFIGSVQVVDQRTLAREVA